MSGAIYTLEQAEQEIATLRGQVDKLTEVLTFGDMTSPGPNNPAAGSILYSLGGQAKYASSDGNDYNTGRALLYVTTAQALTSTSMVDIASLTFTPGLATYGFKIRLIYQNTAGTTALRLGLAGPAASSLKWGVIPMVGNISGVVWESTYTNVAGPATGSSNFYVAEIQGVATFTAVSAFTAQGACQGASTGVQIMSGSTMEMFPLT